MGRRVSCILAIITSKMEFTGQFSLNDVNYKLTTSYLFTYLLTYSMEQSPS